MWLVAFAAARAECTFRATREDLDRALDAAEAAYASLDVERFEAASTELDFVVPCLAVVLDPERAARLHRLRGLGRFADGDRDGALASLAAAKQIAPAYTFSDDVLPPGFELRDAYDGFPTEPAPTDRTPGASRGGTLVFDGVVGRDRPLRPTVWQRTELALDTGDEAVVETRYLDADDPLPPYPGANHRRIPWLVGAGVTALAGGASLGAAGSVAGPVRRADEPLGADVLDQKRATANALTTAGWGLLAAGAVELGIGLSLGGAAP